MAAGYRSQVGLGMILAPLALVAPTVRAQAVTFEDVTVAAGLSYSQWDGNTPPSTTGGELEFFHMTAGAAAGDYDNDGACDLFVTRINAANLLFHNLGDGTFDEVGLAAGVALDSRSSGCVWGDVNNDGLLDLYVLTFDPSDTHHLYINQGAGQFIDDAAARGVALAGPFNGTRMYSSPAFGDYDLDGDLDLLVTAWNQHNRLFQNDGTGHFVDVTVDVGFFIMNAWGFSGQFADMDDDGRPDLLVAADFGSSRAFRNLGDGTFEHKTWLAGLGTDENGMGSCVGDYDGDEDLDWFVTSIFDPNDTCAVLGCNWGTTGNRLYRNDGAWSFSDQTDATGVRDGQWGWAATFLDYDNDADLDLAMAAGVRFPHTALDDSFNNDPLRLWRTAGGGAKAEVAAQCGFVNPHSGKGLLVFDYDNDGDQDVFVANNQDPPVLLRNNGGNANDWLSVRLRGSLTNAFGIGARVFVQADAAGPRQMHEVSCNNNFMSQNEVAAHFGLGAHPGRIALVRVQWPRSGTVSTLRNVASDQRIRIFETPCAGDVDADADADLSDLAIVLARFGATGMSLYDGDLDGDEDVDLSDLAQVLAQFGATCNP